MVYFLALFIYVFYMYDQRRLSIYLNGAKVEV